MDSKALLTRDSEILVGVRSEAGVVAAAPRIADARVGGDTMRHAAQEHSETDPSRWRDFAKIT